MRYPVLWTVLLTALTAGALSLLGQDASAAPDQVFYNGKIITVDSAFRIQQAFAVKAGRFTAVGGNNEVRALAGKQTRLVDLGGRAVIPGLMDNHNHQYRAASTLLRGLAMADVGSVREMLDRIRKAAASAKPGETLYATGGWRPETFPEKRPPTRQELDEVSAGHPVIAFRGRGEAYANSAALKGLGITAKTEKFAESAVPKDSSGEPTGALAGSGNGLLDATAKLIPPPDREEKKQLILKMQKQQNALGLTSIRELELSPEIMRVYTDLWHEGKLTMRVSMGLEGNLAEPEAVEAVLKGWGVGPGFGNDWLMLDTVAELGIDGQFENAYLRAPFADPPGNFMGLIRTTPEKVRQTLSIINRYGWRPSIHTMGDKALDVILDGYEAVDKESSIRDKRWVVEHIPIVHADQMDRLARLGVLVSAQAQPYSVGNRMLKAWGTERANGAVPMRELLDHHLSVSSGTDWPAFTSNPFINIYFFVTRNTADAGTLGAGQKISREEALRVTTINNAYLTFQEKLKGSIETGKVADFLILPQDILTMPGEQIRDMRPVATYVDGKKVFSGPGADL